MARVHSYEASNAHRQDTSSPIEGLVQWYLWNRVLIVPFPHSCIFGNEPPIRPGDIHQWNERLTLRFVVVPSSCSSIFRVPKSTLARLDWRTTVRHYEITDKMEKSFGTEVIGPSNQELFFWQPTMLIRQRSCLWMSEPGNRGTISLQRFCAECSFSSGRCKWLK